MQGEKAIVGSMIGGPAAMREMLAFSAQHKCYPACEVVPFNTAQKAFHDVEKGKFPEGKFRLVLEIKGFRAAQA